MHLQIRHMLVAAFILSLGGTLVYPSLSQAIDPKFELDPAQLDRKISAPTSPTSAQPAAKPVAKPAEKPGRDLEKGSEYKVKPGDHLFKILQNEFGLSNPQAEALIPTIKKMNKISDIRRLKVGSTIVIPPFAKKTEQVEKSARKGRVESVGKTAGRSGIYSRPKVGREPVQGFRMVAVASNEVGNMGFVRQIWDRLIPADRVAAEEPVSVVDRNFSLSLDPAHFPSFLAADGGKILVDAGGTLPPLVKSLISEKDPNTRIVSENPANRKRFFSALLSAAKFYSVEENFTLEFGDDPKLKVNSDFKIEKNPDSLMGHELYLMNVSNSRSSMPESLVSFLNGEGFQVVESSHTRPASRDGRKLYLIHTRVPNEIADELMNSLSIPYVKDRSIELFGRLDAGVKLDVRVDRYFEDKGERFVVSSYNGDPVNYTLMRLLETKGYKVIMLEDKDNFRKVSEKILTRLRLSGHYGNHTLWSMQDNPYTVQISGFLLQDKKIAGRNILLTDRELSPLMKELIDYNGYNVINN